MFKDPKEKEKKEPQAQSASTAEPKAAVSPLGYSPEMITAMEGLRTALIDAQTALTDEVEAAVSAEVGSIRGALNATIAALTRILEPQPVPTVS